MEAPLVTVLVPARNEAADIERCLQAVAAQDLPRSLIEVVVATADSTDDTATIAAQTLEHAGFDRVEILSGGPGSTPANLNAGLAAATGEYLCRVDARSIIPPTTCGAASKCSSPGPRSPSPVARRWPWHVMIRRQRSALPVP